MFGLVVWKYIFVLLDEGIISLVLKFWFSWDIWFLSIELNFRDEEWFRKEFVGIDDGFVVIWFLVYEVKYLLSFCI